MVSNSSSIEPRFAEQPTQTKVISTEDSQRFVGSIINPQGFSKDGKKMKKNLATRHFKQL